MQIANEPIPDTTPGMMSSTRLAAMKQFAAALAVGGAGAALAFLLGLPAPFITGPAILVTLAGLGGVAMAIPVAARDLAFVFIGLTMGTGVTPEVLDAAGRWPVSLGLLGLSVLAIILVCRFLLMRHFGQDGRTAVLSSAPGHLSYLLGMADAGGLNVRMIAVVQSTRILILTLSVPPLVILLDRADMVHVAVRVPMSIFALGTSVALALVTGFAFKRLRLPAAFLIAGMAISTATHLSGSVAGHVPQWAAVPAFVMLGILIGTRFSGVSLRELRQALSAGLLVTGVAIVIAVAAAFLAARLTGLPLDMMLIALAPGGVETMSAMAQLMHVDATFVTAHHVARLFLLTFLVPFILGRQKDGGATAPLDRHDTAH